MATVSNILREESSPLTAFAPSVMGDLVSHENDVGLTESTTRYSGSSITANNVLDTLIAGVAWNSQSIDDQRSGANDVTRTGTNVIPYAVKANWQSLARSGLSEEGFSYIRRLSNKPDGWRGEGSRAMSSESLERFLQFWHNAKLAAKEPEFSLLPNGNLQAEWYKNSRRFLEIEFKPSDRVLIGFVNGEEMLHGRYDIKGTVDLLLRHPDKPLKWA